MNQKSFRISDNGGFTLTEILVALGLLAIVTMGIITSMQSQMGSNNFLQFQIKRSTLNANLVGQFLSDPDNCKCLFNGAAPFPIAGTSALTGVSPTTLGVFKFVTPGDCSTATVPAPWLTSAGIDQMKTSSISLKNITNLGSAYQGNFEVQIKSIGKVSGPDTIVIRIPVSVSTTPAGPGNVNFNGCSVVNSGVSSSSCPAGMNGVGTPGTASFYCIDAARRPSATQLNAIGICSAVTDPTMGSGHVCDYQEWTLACVKNISGMGPGMLGGGGETVAAGYADSLSGGRRAVALVGTGSTYPQDCLNFTGTNDGTTDTHGYRCCLGAF